MKGRPSQQGSTDSNLVCLDTDILIGLLKGDRTAINTLRKLENEPVKTTTITAYELLKGALISTKPEENTLAVRRLLSTLQLLTLNEGSCGKASEVYKVLKLSLIHI